VVVAVVVEADEAVGAAEVVVAATIVDTAVAAVEDTVVGEEDATGGERMRSTAMIRLILRNWSQFGSVL